MINLLGGYRSENLGKSLGIYVILKESGKMNFVCILKYVMMWMK